MNLLAGLLLLSITTLSITTATTTTTYKKARLESCGGCEKKPVKVFIVYEGRTYDNFEVRYGLYCFFSSLKFRYLNFGLTLILVGRGQRIKGVQ